MIDVLVAGELYIDLIFSGFDSLPQPGREAFASRFSREIGGGTAITAAGLAKLGVRCGVYGLVGEDSGEWVKKRLQQEHVDVGQVQQHPTEPTAITVVVTSAHDRAFLSYQGANYAFEESLLESVRSADWLAPKHVHLAYAPLPANAIELCEHLHRKGSTISLDVGWREDWLSHPEVMAILRHVDIFFPNLPEAQKMTGEGSPTEILKRFSHAGVERVALKLGSQGSAFCDRGSTAFAKPPNVRPVDTTGAGDCFDAGFLEAWLSGKDPETCLLQGNICGAFSTLAYGGISGFPARPDIEHELMRLNNA
ncbi:MAG: carbohydrate kinase family protein [Bryobacteraceae bacterium]